MTESGEKPDFIGHMIAHNDAPFTQIEQPQKSGSDFNFPNDVELGSWNDRGEQ